MGNIGNVFGFIEPFSTANLDVKVGESVQTAIDIYCFQQRQLPSKYKPAAVDKYSCVTCPHVGSNGSALRIAHMGKLAAVTLSYQRDSHVRWPTVIDPVAFFIP